MKMTENTFKVKPCSRADLRKLANHIRKWLKITSPMFPVVLLLDGLTQIDESFNYVIEEDSEFPEGVHAFWAPLERVMHIRETVYDNACAGKGRDRMTIAHEFGHLLLHTDQYPVWGRQMSRGNILPFESSEWQAKAFAAELLLPADQISVTDVAEDLAVKYGVSVEAAEVQLNVIRKERRETMQEK